MLDIVLRVYDEQFDVQSFLSQQDSLVTSEVYNQGEPDIFGGTNAFSGFDVIVAEQADSKTGFAAIEQFLTQHQAMFVALKQDAVSCVMDLDFTVSADEQMPDSLSLPVALLSQFSELNIAIEFSAYPALAAIS